MVDGLKIITRKYTIVQGWIMDQGKKEDLKIK